MSSDLLKMWAPRLKPALLRKLYEHEAKGILEESLMDEVGFALLARCESIVRVTDRLCPVCGAKLRGAEPSNQADRPISCVSCDYRSTWREYHRSYKKDRVHGGRGTPAFRAFLDEFPRCKGMPEKMLCVDRLVHAVHEGLNQVYTRPAAHNLFAGKNDEVVSLLNELAFADSVSREQLRNRERYAAQMSASREPTAKHEADVSQRRKA